MPVNFLPEPIRNAPAALGRLATNLNLILRFARIVNNAEGRDGIRVDVTDGNMIISADVLASGGGLPDGYGPEEFTVCEDGAPVTRNFITDNPD
jgi:hypothetical protein